MSVGPVCEEQWARFYILAQTHHG